jgi:molybdopterin molybdotransferase
MQNDSLAALAAELPRYTPEALPLSQAREIVDRLAWAPRQREVLPLAEAAGRVLASDVISPLRLPAMDTAAADGYALRGAEIHLERSTRFLIATGEATPPAHGVPIRLGDPLPPGFNTVAPDTAVLLQGDSIVVSPHSIWPGDFRRRAGEDMALGSVALAAGRRLRPIDLALLSSLGLMQAPVWRRLRVAVMATGDYRDANRHALNALLARIGAESIDLGSLPEQPEALYDAFRHGARTADAVLSAGGIEGGDRSIAVQALSDLAQVQSWNLCLNPGGAMAIACVDSLDRQAMVFALPSDPMALLSIYHALVRDALLGLAGSQREHLPLLRAAAARDMRKQPGRTEFKCGHTEMDPELGWVVEDTAPPGGSTLGSMSRANGIIVLDHEQGDVAAGQLINVMPFEGLV